MRGLTVIKAKIQNKNYLIVLNLIGMVLFVHTSFSRYSTTIAGGSKITPKMRNYNYRIKKNKSCMAV